MRPLRVLLLSLFFLNGYQTHAQRLPTIAEKTQGFEKKTGFIPFWIDPASGKLFLEIDRLDQDFLYVTSLPAGLGSNDIGLDRGLLGDRRIVRFNRVGRKVLLIQPNQKFRALSSDAAERRAVETSFAQSVLWGFVAEAEEDGRVLVDATDFLLRDAMEVASRLRAQKQGTYRVEAGRSALYAPRTKNFPQNTELEATVTYVGGDDAGGYVNAVAPSAEALTLRLHHSFVQLPDAGYRPRRFDPRSSFNAVSFYDYSTPVDQPIEQFYLVRHRLQKRDPAARVSEAVEPIVYYLDNGTPEPIRSALLEGARWWNTAFEAAGYRNAFQVRVLPDSADPMDVRYNVINWVHRATRGWSYGASVVDPRTGEIIKGHVTLGSLRVRQDYLIAQGLLSPFETGKPADPRLMQLALNRLKQLSAHEIGHTLGLMHNYAASVNDRASVMDYPHPTVQLDARGNVDVANAYDLGIGAWDKVSINFGYREFPAGTDERKALNNILETAQKEGLLFLTDQDARPASSLSPTAHLWDNGRDPIAELRNTLAVRKKALSEFSEKTIPVGTPLAMLEDALVPIYNYHRYQVEAVAKLVGAMDYRYALRGDGQVPTAFVPAERQLAALDAVLETLQPGVLTVPEAIVKTIPPRPAGYPNSRELFKKRTGLAFDPLAAAEAAADFPIGLLLTPERANRLVEHDARGNGPGLSTVLTKLIDGLWRVPAASGLDRAVQQQTQQIFLTHLMALSQAETASYATKAAATEALKNLKTYLDGQKSATGVDVAHVEYALERMKNPAAAKTVQHRELPPGAPIGCGEEF
jgi:hypothetical protein